MTGTRDLLDGLGRTTLVRLIHERGLATSRENEERRKTLAHSYHGDVEALINDLNRQELVDIFRRVPFEVGGEWMYLPNPAKYRHDELRAFAVRGFVGRRVRIVGEFRPVSELDGEFDDQELGKDDCDDEEENDGGEGDAAVDQRGHADVGDDDITGRLGDIGTSWSRPRQITRLLQACGHEVPQRLRTNRFQELITTLRDSGFEACFGNDHTGTPIGAHDDSPGIAAKLRLRRRTTVNATSPAGSPQRSLDPAGEGPAIVVKPEPRVAQGIARPSDYNLAVLRLQFLTAVPSVQRRTMPEWPMAYLAAATTGLQLRPQEAALLRAYSAGLSIGNHSPYDSIPHLRQALSATEWEKLLEDFVTLNPFHPEFVQAIVEQIEPVAAPRSEARTWRSAEPTPEDFREPTKSTEPSRAPAAARGRSATSTPEHTEPGTNVRDLGALSGMFDDE